MPGGLRSNKGSNVGVGAGGLSGVNINFKIEGIEKTEADFKTVRSRINTVMRDTVVEFGERELLTIMRTRFPVKREGSGGLAAGRMASSLYVKRDRTSVAIASRLTGKLNRALGWIDFGGSREYVTKKGSHVKQAYREGPKVIMSTIDAKRDGLDRRLLEAMIETFGREGFEVHR